LRGSALICGSRRKDEEFECLYLKVSADIGPYAEFVGNPVTIRTTARRPRSGVDRRRATIEYGDCVRSELRTDDIERSVGLVLGLERVADIATFIVTLTSPLDRA
jgi:hypothetical protein